jgi:ATP-binding cassette subfamily B protein/subfamily B ATP-binding cassette protein MsbA
MFAWNWKLALAAWVVLPVMLFISLMWIRRIRPIFRSAGRDRNIIDARATETFGGIRVVRSFRREPREQAEYTLADDTMIRKRLFGLYSAMVIDSVWGVLIPVSVLMLVIVGGFLYIHEWAPGTTVPEAQRVTVGQIMGFMVLMPALLMPIFRIVNSLNQTQEALAAMERVFEVFDMPADKPDRPDAADAPRQVRTFEFDQVCFRYSDEGPEVIQDFSLHVPGGSVVALVGPSGAGKTTLTDLIARFYDPTAGTIRLNGLDLRGLKLATFRRLLAVVPQETFLFDGTVRQNISYGRRGASEQQVIDAARRANALGFIEDLPRGFDTLIGERGVKLSGGQRQRISIARALMVDPEFIVADEPVSALDVSIQAQILNLLMDAQAQRGLTYMFITHDLSVVQHISTRVAVMYLGTLCELSPAGTLFDSPRHPYTQALLSAIPKLGHRKSSHVKLKGEVPTPIALPSGCVFHGRCVHADPRCAKEIPAARKVENDVIVACHAVEEGRL